MAGYDWIYGRSRGAGERGRGLPPGPSGNRQQPGSRNRYDAGRGRYDTGMAGGWGTHPGESYIENFGSYGTEAEGGPFAGRRSDQGRGQGPGFGGRGSEVARGGYSTDFNWSLGGERGAPRYDAGYGRRRFGVRYDDRLQGRRRGG